MSAPAREARGASQAGPQLCCVIADDHPAVLDSLSRVIEAHGIMVVARVRDGDDAISAINTHAPDVAVIDLRMPGMSGMAVARRVAGSTHVILYTGHGDGTVVAEALDAGVRGFVLKEAPLNDVARAVETVGNGGIYIDPVLAGALASGERSGTLKLLSQREREVLRLLADGMRNEEIGRRLHIAAETARAHIRNAMRKLGAETRTQAVATALRRSMIE
jgi:two-component system nitrate/nitrite response regulator NarL